MVVITSTSNSAVSPAAADAPVRRSSGAGGASGPGGADATFGALLDRSRAARATENPSGAAKIRRDERHEAKRAEHAEKRAEREADRALRTETHAESHPAHATKKEKPAEAPDDEPADDRSDSLTIGAPDQPTVPTATAISIPTPAQPLDGGSAAGDQAGAVAIAAVDGEVPTKVPATPAASDDASTIDLGVIGGLAASAGKPKDQAKAADASTDPTKDARATGAATTSSPPDSGATTAGLADGSATAGAATRTMATRSASAERGSETKSTAAPATPATPASSANESDRTASIDGATPATPATPSLSSAPRARSTATDRDPRADDAAPSVDGVSPTGLERASASFAETAPTTPTTSVADSPKLTGVERREVVDQILDRAQLFSAQNGKGMTIRLDPPELGALHMRVFVQNGEVSVHVATETTQARDMIQAGWARLQEGLTDRGLRADTLVVQQSSGAGSAGLGFGTAFQSGGAWARGDADDGRYLAGRGRADEPVTTARTETRSISSSGLVDYRV